MLLGGALGSLICGLFTALVVSGIVVMVLGSVLLVFDCLQLVSIHLKGNSGVRYQTTVLIGFIAEEVSF